MNLMIQNKKCKICKKQTKGRSDKLFCSVKCKNFYHANLRRITEFAGKEINKILHRNHSILSEILGKKRLQIKINRILLEKKKFNYKYHTHTTINSRGKKYYYLYNLAWMEFSNDDILIIRKQ